MQLNFDLDKIKFSIDEPTWEKAIVILVYGIIAHRIIICSKT